MCYRTNYGLRSWKSSSDRSVFDWSYLHLHNPPLNGKKSHISANENYCWLSEYVSIKSEWRFGPGSGQVWFERLTFLEHVTESNNDEGDFRKQLIIFSQVSFTVELSLKSNHRPPFWLYFVAISCKIFWIFFRIVLDLSVVSSACFTKFRLKSSSSLPSKPYNFFNLSNFIRISALIRSG